MLYTTIVASALCICFKFHLSKFSCQLGWVARAALSLPDWICGGAALSKTRDFSVKVRAIHLCIFSEPEQRQESVDY